MANPWSGSRAASAFGRVLSRAVSASSIFPRALASAVFAVSACSAPFDREGEGLAAEVKLEPLLPAGIDDVVEILDWVEAQHAGRRASIRPTGKT